MVCHGRSARDHAVPIGGAWFFLQSSILGPYQRDSSMLCVSHQGDQAHLVIECHVQVAFAFGLSCLLKPSFHCQFSQNLKHVEAEGDCLELLMRAVRRTGLTCAWSSDCCLLVIARGASLVGGLVLVGAFSSLFFFFEFAVDERGLRPGKET